VDAIKNPLALESVNFPEFFSEMLKDAGFSQAAFGRAVGVTGPFINMICRGRATPPLDCLDLWSSALKLAKGSPKFHQFRRLAALAHIPDQALRDELSGQLDRIDVMWARLEVLEQAQTKAANPPKPAQSVSPKRPARH
jgi:transcriptional regulator with XRE-family HTH domain